MRRSLAIPCVAVLLAAVAMWPVETFGTSYDPLPHGEEGRVAAPASPGATIFLFCGGSEEGWRSIREGDNLKVYRPLEGGGQEAVGMLRVVARAGALCLRALVLEGEVQSDEVAVTGLVTCLVMQSAVPCQCETGR